jgi:hypothetical protein
LQLGKHFGQIWQMNSVAFSLLMGLIKYGVLIIIGALLCVIGVLLYIAYKNPNMQSLVFALSRMNLNEIFRAIVISEPSPSMQVCKFDASKMASWEDLADEGNATLLDLPSYYAEYHGHQPKHLARVHTLLRKASCGSFIFLAGDSSLDNKHWFFVGWKSKEEQLSDPENNSFIGDAVNGYENVLNPSKMVKDVSYWLNVLAAERLGPRKLTTIMSSVEESTIEDRFASPGGLLAQDCFIRDHISENDYLILSVGGNDVALRPTVLTALYMKLLVASPSWLIKSGYALGFGYFMCLFHTRVQELVRRICAKRKPKRVLVCMIYYLDQKSGGSWADHTLAALGYDKSPAKLQLVIRSLFERIKSIGFDVPGVQVDAFPLFKTLDGTNCR